MSEEIEIIIELIAKTDKAFLIHNLKDEKTWIPRSQITDYTGEEDNPETIFISQWLAEEKGLV